MWAAIMLLRIAVGSFFWDTQIELQPDFHLAKHHPALQEEGKAEHAAVDLGGNAVVGLVQPVGLEARTQAGLSYASSEQTCQSVLNALLI